VTFPGSRQKPTWGATKWDLLRLFHGALVWGASHYLHISRVGLIIRSSANVSSSYVYLIVHMCYLVLLRPFRFRAICGAPGRWAAGWYPHSQILLRGLGSHDGGSCLCTHTISSSVLDFATTYVYQQLPSHRHIRLLGIVNFACNTTPLPETQPTGHHAGTTVSLKIFTIDLTQHRSSRLTVSRHRPLIAWSKQSYL
jgi:hypothetical protein